MRVYVEILNPHQWVLAKFSMREDIEMWWNDTLVTCELLTV